LPCQDTCTSEVAPAHGWLALLKSWLRSSDERWVSRIGFEHFQGKKKRLKSYFEAFLNVDWESGNRFEHFELKSSDFFHRIAFPQRAQLMRFSDQL